DQGAGSIVTADARPGGRRNEPASVLGGPQQRRKTGAGIKSRPTQPIDRAVTPDQRGRPTIANDGVVLDRHRHDAYSENSMMTLMSFESRMSASFQRSRGTRRVIRRPSQSRSARTSAAAAAS